MSRLRCDNSAANSLDVSKVLVLQITLQDNSRGYIPRLIAVLRASCNLRLEFCNLRLEDRIDLGSIGHCLFRRILYC